MRQAFTGTSSDEEGGNSSSQVACTLPSQRPPFVTKDAGDLLLTGHGPHPPPALCPCAQHSAE